MNYGIDSTDLTNLSLPLRDFCQWDVALLIHLSHLFSSTRRRNGIFRTFVEYISMIMLIHECWNLNRDMIVSRNVDESGWKSLAIIVDREIIRLNYRGDYT